MFVWRQLARHGAQPLTELQRRDPIRWQTWLSPATIDNGVDYCCQTFFKFAHVPWWQPWYTEMKKLKLHETINELWHVCGNGGYNKWWQFVACIRERVRVLYATVMTDLSNWIIYGARPDLKDEPQLKEIIGRCAAPSAQDSWQWEADE